jgi:hypothetical protein
MAANVSDNRYGNRVYMGMLPPFYDRVDVAYPSGTVEDYAFSTLQPNIEPPTYDLMSVIRIVYTDDTKCLIATVCKTFKREERD